MTLGGLGVQSSWTSARVGASGVSAVESRSKPTTWQRTQCVALVTSPTWEWLPDAPMAEKRTTPLTRRRARKAHRPIGWESRSFLDRSDMRFRRIPGSQGLNRYREPVDNTRYLPKVPGSESSRPPKRTLVGLVRSVGRGSSAPPSPRAEAPVLIVEAELVASMVQSGSSRVAALATATQRSTHGVGS